MTIANLNTTETTEAIDTIESSVQGVCKDCGNGTLNNRIHQAFIVDEFDGTLIAWCASCGSDHLDLLVL